MKRAIVFAALAALTVGACEQKGARASCPAGKNCLEIGNAAEPNTLDPGKSTASWENRIISDLMEGLTKNDPGGRPVPGIATRWETTPDGLIWTFHLRKAKWSDGTEVTANDFVYGMRRLMDPKNAAEYAFLLYIIKNGEAVNSGKMPPTALGVTALDPYTLQITLEHPAPYLLELAKHPTMLPVQQQVVEKYGDAWSKPGNYVSNGPYKLTYWRLGDKVTLEKNPYYEGSEKLCIDRVSYYPTEDRRQAERQVQSGELDISDKLTPNRINYLREEMGLGDYIRTYGSLTIQYLQINLTLDKFKDPRVRRALQMAIDRKFIAAGPFGGGGPKPAYRVVPPGTANYTPPPDPEWSTWPIEKRHAEARKLLAEAGYGPNKPLTIALTHRSTEGRAELEAVQSDWDAIGVKTTLIGVETQVAYQTYRLRDFEFADAGWGADYNDALSFLNQFNSKTGQMNYSPYINPAYDDLLTKSDNEPDLQKRADYLRQAEAMLVADDVAFPIYYDTSSLLVNPRVTGFVDNVINEHNTEYLCFKDAKR